MYINTKGILANLNKEKSQLVKLYRDKQTELEKLKKDQEKRRGLEKRAAEKKASVKRVVERISAERRAAEIKIVERRDLMASAAERRVANQMKSLKLGGKNKKEKKAYISLLGAGHNAENDYIESIIIKQIQYAIKNN